MASSLQLPEGSEIAFRNLKDAKLLAMDIGGSLTKIAYYSTVPVRRIVYDVDSGEDTVADTKGRREVLEGTVYEILEGARLHFIKFETRSSTFAVVYNRGFQPSRTALSNIRKKFATNVAGDRSIIVATFVIKDISKWKQDKKNAFNIELHNLGFYLKVA